VGSVLGAFLVTVRDVLGATVGSLGALLVGAVLTAISKLPVTTKQGMPQKN